MKLTLRKLWRRLRGLPDADQIPATIHYTTDGSDPASAKGHLYTGQSISIDCSKKPVHLRVIGLPKL